MGPRPTTRLYLHDDHCLECDAMVSGNQGTALAFDQTCLYPGGGGQPADTGTVVLEDGPAIEIMSTWADADGIIWHDAATPPPADSIGRRARLCVDGDRRRALSRYHTVLHVLNTITLRHHGGWITGAHIATDYARIDFNLPGLSAALCADLETTVNAVLAENHTLSSSSISEHEMDQRDDLRRTLLVSPPVFEGRVRIVTIAGFDEQACGGTHVRSTSELGRLSIYRTENKGKINKRLYVRLI